jgi:RNA polymerase sigma-70 factor (ECF subfamily)
VTAETEADTDFAGYVDDVGPDLLAYFVRRVFPTEDAADLVAETMIVLWRRQSDLPNERDSARAWAFGVARQVLRNYRRAGARRLALTDALRSQLQSLPPSNAGELRVELSRALAALREVDRELVLLVAWEGLSLELAAVSLGIKAPAARARYSRARAKLREVLG